MHTPWLLCNVVSDLFSDCPSAFCWHQLFGVMRLSAPHPSNVFLSKWKSREIRDSLCLLSPRPPHPHTFLPQEKKKKDEEIQRLWFWLLSHKTTFIARGLRKFRHSTRMTFFYVLLHSFSLDLIIEKCCALHSFLLKLNVIQVEIKLVQN